MLCPFLELLIALLKVLWFNISGGDSVKVSGIVAEYNPFHNGHKYHIEETRRITGCDAVAAVMSGSFVQRGEPSVFDKWSRAAAAIEGGVDLVLELPVYYSLKSAEGFVFGAVSILNA